ncbi:MAG: NYN domain-containing protein, partial [Bacteroidales bacterium]|nr:NYN domain-containing protein [Bacteroidales bacterium]
MENYKIALLIDAENISNKYADGILNSLTKYGRVIVKKAYVSVDDKGAVTPNAWINTCKNKGMHLVTQTRNASGKNCVDSKLIIDA